MKATGIVRRIDDLGRVVIPKEIRRTMRIREGDPLEIYTDADGEVIFKKYSPIGEMSQTAAKYSEVLAKCTPFAVVVCDRDHCIAAAGISKREVLDRRVAPSLEEYTEDRRSFVLGKTTDDQPIVLEGISRRAAVIVPIISAGDVSGSVILLQDESNSQPEDSDVKLASVAAAFLGKQLEE